MQYQVPQFIETEDKIIAGLITLRQFFVIAGGAGVSFILFFLVGFFTWMFLTMIIGSLVIAIAFIKISGRSLPTIGVSAFNYFWNPRFYLWRTEKAAPPPAPRLQTKLTGTEETKPFAFAKRRPAFLETPPPAAPKEEEPKHELAPLKKIEEKPRHVAHLREMHTHAETRKLPPPHEAPPHAEESRKEAAPEPVSSRDVSQKIKKPEIETPRVEEAPPAAAPLPQFFKKEPLETPRPEDTEEKSQEELPTPMPQPIFRLLPPKAAERRPLISEPQQTSPFDIINKIRQRLGAQRSIQELAERIMTSRNILPKREKKISSGLPRRGRYEVLRRYTGEVEEARRVDYK